MSEPNTQLQPNTESTAPQDTPPAQSFDYEKLASEIGSKNIIADSFELKQSICDDGEFTLGGCIAGQLTIQIIGIEQALNNKRINVFIRQTYSKGDLLPADSLYPADTLFPGAQTETIEKPIFSGTINSSLRQKNRAVKEIIAYDDIYIMSQIKCKNWFLGYVQHTVTALCLVRLLVTLCRL